MGDDDPTSPHSRPPVKQNISESSMEVIDESHLSPNSKEGSPEPNTPTDESTAKTHAPTQKRRRVTRACDECRRKKIKCDGKQPCTHCTVYSYECTYDQPSNRRRNPAPQYIEALEQRLQKAERILHTILPGIDVDDPKYDAHGIEQIIETARKPPSNRNRNSKTADANLSDDDTQMQSMVDRTGTLDLDDAGNWDFHGHSSGYVFLRKFRAQFGEQLLPDPRTGKHRMQQVLDSPLSFYSSPYESTTFSTIDLPPKEVAIELSHNTLDDCCALMRPVHRPTYFRRLHSLYDTDPERYTNAHRKFMPMLYNVLAIGSLFAKREHDDSALETFGYRQAMEQGYQYFYTGKQMLDITDCRDLMSLQTVVFMIFFLQATAKLATCYSYIGIALRACCRLGLHRKLATSFNAIETEERKRLFWVVRKLDTYVGAMLGLPQMLSIDDIDQDLPSEINDDYVFEDGLRPMPAGIFPYLRASNAHTKLTFLLQKVVRYVYPIKGPGSLVPGDSHYTISHNLIRELERDLQKWMDELPMELRPSDIADRELTRAQQLLRMSYAHVQIMIYRPFIHYVSQAYQNDKTDKRSFACAAACISVARNIIHITSEMQRRGLLIGAYWFVVYTTYFAILTLVYFVLENPFSASGKDILKDAMDGKETLASLAKRSFAADRCSQSLLPLFEQLPDTLRERRASLKSGPPSGKKRSLEGDGDKSFAGTPASIDRAQPRDIKQGIPRAQTLPHDQGTGVWNRNKSVPVPSFTPTAGVSSSLPHLKTATGRQSPATPPKNSSPFDRTQFQQTSAIPDLKDVMFPGDNPFAYPNLPLSSLDAVDGQYGYQDGGMHPFHPTASANLFGSSSNLGGSQIDDQSIDLSSYNFYDNPVIPPHLNPHSRHFSMPVPAGYGTRPHMFDASNTMPNIHTGSASSSSTNNLNQFQTPQSLSVDDYWMQNNKGQTGTRTGLTPGPGVNLDDLFGGDGWSGMWLDPSMQR